MQLVASMARAKEIEDEALGQVFFLSLLLFSSYLPTPLHPLIFYHQHEPGKQDTELKLHFTKRDHYLPVGMPALDESGKGRELFTTLVEEKSVVRIPY